MNTTQAPHDRPIALSDNIFQLIVRQCKTYKYVILSCLISGFLSFMFALTNKLVNWDELNFLFSKGATLESGRWGLELLDWIIPNISMPWLFGCETIVCVTIACCIFIHVFSIRSHIIQVLLSSLIISFPSLAGTLSYMFTSSAYGIAFLMIALALELSCHKKWYCQVLAILCTVFSLSIYQSYITILSSFFILVLIQRVMFSEEKVKKIFLQGVYYLLFLAVSIVLYFTITLCVNHIMGIQFGQYAKDSISQKLSLHHRLYTFYYFFKRVMLNNTKGLIPPGMGRICNILLMGAIVLNCLFWILQKGFSSRTFLFVLLAVLLPFSIFGLLIAISADNLHVLVLYSFISFYAFAAILMDGKYPRTLHLKIPYKIVCNLTVVCMLFIIIANVNLANEGYFKIYLSHQNAISFGSSLVAELNSIEGYNNSTKVAFVGEYPLPEFYDNFSNTEDMQAFPTLYPDWTIMRYYCGYDVPFASYAEQREIQQWPEVQEMPCYPDHGYIKIINGTAVVKFSD